MECPNCSSKMVIVYRFTDWDNCSYDKMGTYEECQKWFDEAVKDEPEGRFSIYDVSDCLECGFEHDEGVLFNEKCPVYEH